MWFIVILVLIGLILYFYISAEKSSNTDIYEGGVKKPSISSAYRQSEGIEEDDDYLDFITAYEYKAYLDSPHTSLEALNHHGEVRKNNKGIILPEFGDNQRFHGSWESIIPEFENYIDPIPKDPLEPRKLQFLKSFREVYESDMGFNLKYEKISSILQEYSDLPLHKDASKWYLWELQTIPGISHSISEVLFYEGIKTKRAVNEATDEKLLSISGIGPARLKQIRASLSMVEGSFVKKEEYDEPPKKPSKPGSAGSIVEIEKIETSKAHIINLPVLPYGRTFDTEDMSQDWDQYNTITQNALIYYNTKRFSQAKEEWLKILRWQHKDQKYQTNLLRTYRRLIEDIVKKKEFTKAYELSVELLTNCEYYTNTDIRTHNSIVFQLNKTNPDKKYEIKTQTVPEITYHIDGPSIQLLNEISTRNPNYADSKEGTSILKLKSLSDFLPKALPHIDYEEDRITVKGNFTLPKIPNDTFRFRESQNLSSFISSSKELIIHLYNWNLELLMNFDASRYAERHNELRRVELASNLSFFLFTVIDTGYLLDSKLNPIKAWQVPYKKGFEKRVIEDSVTKNSQEEDNLRLLGMATSRPSQEEIKTAFRKSILQWHPDKNPGIPEAEERTRQIIQAYEHLTGEDAQEAFDEIGKQSYYWVDLSKTTQVEVEGFTFELNFSIGSGIDWIYGSGMSEDASRIYLGCYSGKIYQINHNGVAEKIYIAPEGQINNYLAPNPISFVTEYLGRKYFLTKWYLYILKDDKVQAYLKNEECSFKWFDMGFIQQRKYQIKLFNPDGISQGSITFKSPLVIVAFNKGILFVQTTTRSYTFRLSY